MINLIRDKIIEKISKVVFYYFKIKTVVWKYLINMKSNIFKVNKIYEVTEEKKKNLILNYYVYKILNTYFKSMTQKLNTTHELVKAEITNGKVTRNLIFNNKNMADIVESIDKVDFDINELMLNKNYIIKDISLVQNEENIKLRSLIENYSDRSKIYECHTLRNLLKLKNIDHKDSKLLVEYYEIPYGKQVKEYIVDDILDTHISDLYDI